MCTGEQGIGQIPTAEITIEQPRALETAIPEHCSTGGYISKQRIIKADPFKPGAAEIHINKNTVFKKGPGNG